MSTSNKNKTFKKPVPSPAAAPQTAELLEKISILEIKLSDCRNRLSNYEHAYAQPDWPSAKVSFRIDYYRNGDKSDLKGVVEHLPSREKRPFTGLGDAVITTFIQGHLPEATGPEPESVPAHLAPESLAPLFTHLFQPGQTKVESGLRESRLLRRLKAQGIVSAGSAVSRQVETNGEQPRESRLLRKLRARVV